jgi:hypothetical protein
MLVQPFASSLEPLLFITWIHRSFILVGCGDVSRPGKHKVNADACHDDAGTTAEAEISVLGFSDKPRPAAVGLG